MRGVEARRCVNDVHMAGDNKFCFVEFRSATEASNAMALDQMQLLGKNLRVARPNDYQVRSPRLLPPSPASSRLPPPPPAFSFLL